LPTIDLPVIYLGKYIIENKNQYYQFLRKISGKKWNRSHPLFMCRMELKQPQLIANKKFKSCDKIVDNAPCERSF